MGFSPFMAGRTVLFVAEDAVHIYRAGGGGVALVESVPTVSPDFADEVASILDRQCGGKSVVVLYDRADQYYRRGEKIPKVGIMDRAGVVRRRLAMAFPNYPIRAALPLKERTASGEVIKGGGAFLFSAASDSDVYLRLAAAIRKSSATVSGFGMLPVESVDMVAALSKALSRSRKGEPQGWTLFLGQHHGGGLRQVVVRNGEIALTRITPVVDTDENPDLWAAEVLQEVKATLGYLPRYGFTPDDGLEIIAISGPEAGEKLEALIDIPGTFQSMTVSEAARLLGLNMGRQEDQRHADSLHALWVSRKVRLTMPMEAARLLEVSRPRQAASAAVAVLFLGALGVMGYGAFESQKLLVVRSSISGVAEEKAKVDKMFDQEMERQQSLGVNVPQMQASLKAMKIIDKDRVDVLPVLRVVGQALGGRMRLDGVKFHATEHPVAANPNGASQEVPDGAFEMVLLVKFPGNIRPEEGNKAIESLRTRLVRFLPPSHTVEIQKKVADLTYTGDFSEEIGVAATTNQQTPSDFTAEILIKGARNAVTSGN